MGDIFGNVIAPPGVNRYPAVGGISLFFGNIVKFLIVVAALYSLFNFIFAGYGFLAAGDDPKKIQAAWSKIWQTVLGLTVAAGSVVLAAIFGQIIFGDPNALLQIRIFGPGP